MGTAKQISWLRVAAFTSIHLITCYVAWDIWLAARSFKSNVPIHASQPQMVGILAPFVFGCVVAVCFLEVRLKRPLLKYYTIVLMAAAVAVVWIASKP